VHHTSGSHPSTYHDADVRYTYTVQGRTLKGSEVACAGTTNYSFLVHALVERFKPGQPVTVYYNPTNPEEAVLLRAPVLGSYIQFLAFLLAGYWGLRLLLLALIPAWPSRNSRWLPWSHRFTWPDLPVTFVGVIAFLALMLMLAGI
jgi:hypothetical protein